MDTEELAVIYRAEVHQLKAAAIAEAIGHVEGLADAIPKWRDDPLSRPMWLMKQEAGKVLDCLAKAEAYCLADVLLDE